MSLYNEHMQQKVNVFRLECFWALWKEQNEVFPTVPPAGQTNKWKGIKPRVKAVNVPKWAQSNQERYGNLGGGVRDGASDGM
jgi:hypothetical protein